MFIDFVVVIFITAFISIVVLGHVLLITAIWPNGPGKPIEQRFGTVESDLPLIH